MNQMLATKLYYKLKKKRADFRRIWCHKYKVDLGISTPISFSERVKYYRLGFTSEDYHCFNLKANDYRDYISYRERWRLEDINGRFSYFLGEKLLFERLFGHYVNVPHIDCWVKAGTCIEMDAGKRIDILPVLEQKGKLIVKPTRSWGGGTGLHSLAYEGQQYSIDGKPCSADQLRTAVCSWEEAIVVDFVPQAEYSRIVFPETTNTVRVVTGQHKDGKVDVLFSFHRFGSNQSKPVDNISSGGFVSLVDIETGILGPAKTITDPNQFYPIHPETNVKIQGIIIPGWDNIRSRLIHVHECFPCYKFLAWDVVVVDSDAFSILEINRGCDLEVQMLGAQRNEKLGLFMREYGLLDKW